MIPPATKLAIAYRNPHLASASAYSRYAGSLQPDRVISYPRKFAWDRLGVALASVAVTAGVWWLGWEGISLIGRWFR